MCVNPDKFTCTDNKLIVLDMTIACTLKLICHALTIHVECVGCVLHVECVECVLHVEGVGRVLPWSV